MASRPSRRLELIDLGVASVAPTGQIESGDLFVAKCNSHFALLAAIDGIGHGESAAAASRAAVAVLESRPRNPLITLVQECHKELRSTRGVVMSVACLDFQLNTLTWLGIGNVQGILVRPAASLYPRNQALLLRPGVVGSRLPALQTATLPFSPGNTLAFATDGVRSEFADDLSPSEPAQRSADRILAKYYKGNDDALVLVARLLGGPQ
ncbi:MAG TPA: SpoIIE family protein phosphatase [Candidatus Acidoferrum sp.]|nr:SpoIIE family protein phosphatase [Candidatus Acidoferrum sp.]